FDGDGIRVTGAAAVGNVIQGNYVGTNAAGTAAAANTGDGIRVTAGATNTVIGGAGAGVPNLLSGNGGDGLEVNGANTTGTSAQSNLIGVRSDASGPIPNGG